MYEMNTRERTIVELMNKELEPAGITVELLIRAGHGHLRFPMKINSPLMDTDIQDLELSVRSFNCLRRAGIGTIGELVDRIGGIEDLKKIRNLGSKSAQEIMMALFTSQFMALAPGRRRAYMLEVLELNAG